MKKFILALSVVALSTGMFANNSDFTNEATFDETVGLCHIVIYNSNGDIIHDVTLPANSAEACEAMLAATLAAMQ